jgi:hypothetical protein
LFLNGGFSRIAISQTRIEALNHALRNIPAVPCIIGALFLIFLYFSHPVMEAEMEGSAAPAE